MTTPTTTATTAATPAVGAVVTIGKAIAHAPRVVSKRIRTSALAVIPKRTSFANLPIVISA